MPHHPSGHPQRRRGYPQVACVERSRVGGGRHPVYLVRTTDGPVRFERDRPERDHPWTHCGWHTLSICGATVAVSQLYALPDYLETASQVKKIGPEGPIDSRCRSAATGFTSSWRLSIFWLAPPCLQVRSLWRLPWGHYWQPTWLQFFPPCAWPLSDLLQP